MIYGFAVAAIVIAGLLEGAYLYGVHCGEEAGHKQALNTVTRGLTKSISRRKKLTDRQIAFDMSDYQFRFYKKGIYDVIGLLSWGSRAKTK